MQDFSKAEFPGSVYYQNKRREKKKLEAFEKHDSSEKSSAYHLYDTARISPVVFTQLQPKGSVTQPAAAAI